MTMYQPPFKSLPIGSKTLTARIKELAREVEEIYGSLDITILGILQGCIPFSQALTDALPEDGRICPHLFPARSYSGVKSGNLIFHPEWLPAELICGRRVLLLDDILDTGQTLRTVIKAIKALQPAMFHTAVLLRKPGKQVGGDVEVDLIGFDIPPDVFVVGFGMDYNDMFRSRRDIKSLADAQADLQSGRGRLRKVERAANGERRNH
jgi:hypoxanthine phosphoribosyltransferase